MKRITAAFLFLVLAANCFAQVWPTNLLSGVTNVFIGTPGAGLGDPAYTAFGKINADIDMLSNALVNANASSPNSCVIFTNNYFAYQSILYGPYPDQTLTISNAWSMFPLGNNAYAPGGKSTYFTTGVHAVGDGTLVWPPIGYTNTPNGITLYGDSELSTILYNTNLVPVDTLHIATQPGTNQNATVFNMHDLCLATWTNAVGTNILVLSSGGFNGLASAYIHDCLFTCWSLLTNHVGGVTGWSILSTDVGNESSPYGGLCAINLYNSLGDKVKIDHNNFQYIAGLRLVNDHWELLHNTFEACGDPSMPTGLPLSPIVDNTVIYIGDGGGHNQFAIGDNEFVGQGGYTFGPNTGNHQIIGDDYEDGAGWYGTNGCPYVVVNGSGGTWPKIAEVGANYDNVSQFAFNTTFYDVVGNNYNNLQSDMGTNNIGNKGSNFIQQVDFNTGMAEYRASMTNPANLFSGTFGNNFWSITFASGTNLVISNLVAHSNAILIQTNGVITMANGASIDSSGSVHSGNGFYTTAGQCVDNSGDLFADFAGALIFNNATRNHIFEYQCASSTIATNSGVGGNSTATIVGTDTAGTITLVVGSAPAANATLATITDHQGDGTNSVVLLTPINAAASTNAAPYAIGGSSAWTINIGPTPLNASKTYQWDYMQIFMN